MALEVSAFRGSVWGGRRTEGPSGLFQEVQGGLSGPEARRLRLPVADVAPVNGLEQAEPSWGGVSVRSEEFRRDEGVVKGREEQGGNAKRIEVGPGAGHSVVLLGGGEASVGGGVEALEP